jgi:hypothetical protein
MEEIINSANIFVKSIENNDNINTIQNYLSLLIGQINIFYYKYNFLNSQTCTKIDNNINNEQLEQISEQIRNIYPKFVELRKKQFKEIYLDKLECNKKPIDLIDNITRTNKIQSMLSDLSDLLYFNSSEIIKEDESIISNKIMNISNVTNKLTSGSIVITFVIVVVVFILIILVVILLIKKYRVKNTDNMLNTEAN